MKPSLKKIFTPSLDHFLFTIILFEVFLLPFLPFLEIIPSSNCTMTDASAPAMIHMVCTNMGLLLIPISPVQYLATALSQHYFDNVQLTPVDFTSLMQDFSFWLLLIADVFISYLLAGCILAVLDRQKVTSFPATSLE
jgi:hypothetical protein